MLVFIVWFIECAIPTLVNASQVLNWLTAATAIFAFCLYFFGLLEKEDLTYYTNKFCPNIKRTFCILLTCAVCIHLLPHEKESGYKIAAAIVVQSVIDNPQIQTIAGKSYQVVENMLDGYLNDYNKKMGETTKAVTEQVKQVTTPVEPVKEPTPDVKKEKKADKPAKAETTKIDVDMKDVKEVASTVSTTVKDVKEVVSTVNEAVK